MRVCCLLFMLPSAALAQEPTPTIKPATFPTLVNPNCSHCIDEAKRCKGRVEPDRIRPFFDPRLL